MSPKRQGRSPNTVSRAGWDLTRTETVDVESQTRNKPEFLIFRSTEESEESEDTPLPSHERSTSRPSAPGASSITLHQNLSGANADTSPRPKAITIAENIDTIDIFVDTSSIPDPTTSSVDSATSASTLDTSVSALDSEPQSPTILHASTTPIPIERPHRSVRFRSRVRITSGLHHHSKRPAKDSPEGTPQARPRSASHITTRSHESSSSSSRSSSISAPLRSREDDADYKSALGPLGQRVGLLACKTRRHPAGDTVQRRRNPNERTLLLQSPMRPTYVQGDGVQYHRRVYDSDRDGEDEARLNREIDLVFGKWPGRLLNRNWWWWQLEPVICCTCIDDSDTDE